LVSLRAPGSQATRANRRLESSDGRWRLVRGIAGPPNPRDRGGQGFGLERVGLPGRSCTALQVRKELEDAGPPLGRVVELDVEIRDPLQTQPPAELVADERHGPPKRGDRRVTLRRLPDDADPDLGMPEIRG